MTDNDKGPIIAPIDLPAALGLLTRLPVPVDGDVAAKRGAAAAWAFPLVGLVVAVILGVAGSCAMWLGLAPSLVAGLVLGLGIIITGAMHEDGLADTADGLWGGWDRTRRLEIMKDSNIGAYGVIALILSLGLRWQALLMIIAADLMWPTLIAVAMVSRAAMVVNMGCLPNARSSGLSQAVGRPKTIAMGLAGLTALCGATLLGSWFFAVLVVAGIAGFGVALIAKAKIGGQTGDILGATQQVVEIAVLLTISALI